MVIFPKRKNKNRTKEIFFKHEATLYVTLALYIINKVYFMILSVIKDIVNKNCFPPM